MSQYVFVRLLLCRLWADRHQTLSLSVISQGLIQYFAMGAGQAKIGGTFDVRACLAGGGMGHLGPMGAAMALLAVPLYQPLYHFK